MAILVLLSFILFRFWFESPSIPSFGDHPAQYSYWNQILDSIKNNHNSWASFHPAQMGGMPLNEHQYSLAFLGMTGLYQLGIPPEIVYKAFLLGIVIFFILSFYLLCCLWMIRPLAFSMSLLLLCHEEWVYYFLKGFFHQYFAVAIVLILIRSLYQFSHDRIQYIFVPLLLFLSLHAHLYIGIFAYFIVLVWCHFRAEKLGKIHMLRIVFIWILLSLILNLPYLLKIMRSLDWLQNSNLILDLNWKNGWFYVLNQFIGRTYYIESFKIAKCLRLFLIISLIIIGFYQSIKKRIVFTEPIKFWLVIIIFSSLLGSGSIYQLGQKLHIPFVSCTITHGFRFMVFFEIGILILLGMGLEFVLNQYFFQKYKTECFLLILMIPLISIGTHHIPYHWLKLLSHHDYQNKNAIEQWIKQQNLVAPQKIYIQTTYQNLKNSNSLSHWPSMVWINTSVHQMGSWMGGSLFPLTSMTLSENGALFGKSIDELDFMWVRNFCEKWNIVFVILCHPNAIHWAEKTQWLKPIQKVGEYQIFSTGFNSSDWIINQKITESFLLKWIQAYSHFQIHAHSTELQDVTLRLAMHPNWQVFLNKKPILLDKDEIGMMVLKNLPVGDYVLEGVYQSISIYLFEICWAIYLACLFFLLRKIK